MCRSLGLQKQKVPILPVTPRAPLIVDLATGAANVLVRTQPHILLPEPTPEEMLPLSFSLRLLWIHI